MRTISDAVDRLIYSRVHKRCEAWVSTLDRERLGSFAVGGNDLLVAALARESILYKLGGIRLPSLALMADVVTLKILRATDSMENDDMSRVRAEALFWLGMKGGRLSARHAHGRMLYEPDIGDYSRRLRKVYDNPEALSFFENDVWNMEHIQRYIDNGVDASLAREVTIS